MKIGAKTYKLILLTSVKVEKILEEMGLAPDISKNKVGFIDYYSQIIYVKSDIHHDLLAETILHEILHAIVDDSGISAIRFDPNVDISESIVAILSSRLLATLRDNVDILKKFSITTMTV